MDEKKNEYNSLVGKPERKPPLIRPRCKWEDNLRTDLRETGVDCIHLAQYRDQLPAVVNTVINLRVP
jgi:hypothetical protein